MSDDKRYHTARWRRSRAAVLARDRGVCRIVPGCQRRATVCDHITPATASMPDHEFYALSNLRAACMHHNVRRGHVAQFERELRGAPSPPVTGLFRVPTAFPGAKR